MSVRRVEELGKNLSQKHSSQVINSAEKILCTYFPSNICQDTGEQIRNTFSYCLHLRTKLIKGKNGVETIERQKEVLARSWEMNRMFCWMQICLLQEAFLYETMKLTERYLTNDISDV